MGAHVEAWDEVFIRSTRQRANALVVDPVRWAAWWPGCAVEVVDDGVVDVRWRQLAPIPARHHLRVIVDRVRPRDKGLEFSLEGDVTGSGEWFHLDTRRGVVANHLLRGECASRTPRLWLSAHRAITRAGLTGMKDRLEAGLWPGTEPAPALLAHQAQELEVFAREVAAHEAEQAAARAEAQEG